MVTFQESMAQTCDADFVLDGRGMVLSSVANFCLNSFPVLVISQYSIGLINWYEFGVHICWSQQMIHQDFVQVNIFFLQNVVVDDGCGV